MKDRPPPDDDLRGHVERKVRRRVGLKVLGDLGRWADGVEREHANRTRLALYLLALVVLVSFAAAWLILL